MTTMATSDEQFMDHSDMFVFTAAFVVVIVASLYLASALKPRSKRSVSTIPTMIVLGSGGHTCEMLKLAAALDKGKYTPRTFVVAASDSFSHQKATEFDPQAEVVTVPRSREVGQSWLTSVFTTVSASVASFNILSTHRPRLVLCNGPGTCVPICAIAWLNSKVLRISSTVKIVFVESVCRVATMSLSGRILLWFADDVLVQWPELAEKYRGSKYVARFV